MPNNQNNLTLQEVVIVLMCICMLASTYFSYQAMEQTQAWGERLENFNEKQTRDRYILDMHKALTKPTIIFDSQSPYTGGKINTPKF